MLDNRKRYLQLAFNHDASQAASIIPTLPEDERILLEAGTPFIKREGYRGISLMRSLWQGGIVADLKTLDGAVGEVYLASQAGATAATVAGAASVETLDFFVDYCKQLKMQSMVDMLNVGEPLRVVRQMRKPPDAVILHKGRDEEGTRGKTIAYKHANKLRSKYDLLISAAGGVDLHEARSAVFNGANIVVVNIVSPQDPWQGIKTNENVAQIARQFLDTIE